MARWNALWDWHSCPSFFSLGIDGKSAVPIYVNALVTAWLFLAGSLTAGVRISDAGFNAKEKNRLDGEIQPVFTESLTQ